MWYDLISEGKDPALAENQTRALYHSCYQGRSTYHFIVLFQLNWLNLTGIKYTYDAATNPDFRPVVQMINVSGADLQLCSGERSALNNALR